MGTYIDDFGFDLRPGENLGVRLGLVQEDVQCDSIIEIVSS